MKKLILSLILGLAICSPAFAQTALTTTSLSAAVTSTSTTTFRVASTTGIVAGSTILYIEDGTIYNGEAVFVNSVSGTALSVTRGYFGTQANQHLANIPVIIGNPTQFATSDPAGVCVAANTVSPFINIKSGNQWICSSVSGSWVPGFFNIEAPTGVTTAVASVAGATNPSGPLFHITGTNAITAWGSSTTAGLGAGGGSTTNTVGAPFCIIPDAIFTVTATNNIALASTAVVNKILCYTFDQTNKKFVPTY